ncbi:MAG TPA: helix-turn-helix transcriptional regulator [Symbiobacteriaceae bacterium]|nr:helix-turn-helix transcriptional regulator [Symbiobacteriaceae bacterium]
MGNLYRFMEPVVLYALKVRGETHGYDLVGAINQYALTDAEIERASLYRTLKQLESSGYVTSRWETDGGPARRLYRLTPEGERHLQEWVVVLDYLSRSMARFVSNAQIPGEEPCAVPREV